MSRKTIRHTTCTYCCAHIEGCAQVGRLTVNQCTTRSDSKLAVDMTTSATLLSRMVQCGCATEAHLMTQLNAGSVLYVTCRRGGQHALYCCHTIPGCRRGSLHSRRLGETKCWSSRTQRQVHCSSVKQTPKEASSRLGLQDSHHGTISTVHSAQVNQPSQAVEMIITLIV